MRHELPTSIRGKLRPTGRGRAALAVDPLGIRAPHADADQVESPLVTAPLGWLDAVLDSRPSIRLAGRAALGVSDQAFVSLVNFALGVTVARLVSPTDFGAFGVAFAVYLVALNI